MATRLKDTLYQICRHHFGSTPVPQGIESPSTGRFNDSLFFSWGGRDLVFRMAPDESLPLLFYERNMMAQEPKIHALLRDKTSVPVPEILVYDDTCTIAQRPYLVMERLPGRPLTGFVSSQAREHALLQVGRYLREVHALQAETYGYIGAHRPMEPANAWAEAFTTMWNKLLDDICACKGYSTSQADRLRALQQQDRDLFDYDAPASLLHMDVWAENILTDGHTVTGLIDWDRVLWGDPEIEFAVLDYCGISTEAFWQGYGQQRDTSPAARRRGVYYFLYELQKYIVIERGRRQNIARANQYVAESLRLADLLEG